MRRQTFATQTALTTAVLTLVACAPTTATKPAVYQASKNDVMQAVMEITAGFPALPGFQSLVLWSQHTNNSQITFTSAIRIKAEALNEPVVNANDDREIIFRFEEKAGQTWFTYSKTGYVDQQVNTVMNALDKRFARINLP